MRSSLSFALIALATFGQIAPAIGQTEGSSNEPCNASVLRSMAKLKQVKGLEVMPAWRVYEATGDDAQALPTGRPKSISLVIDGKAANSVMRSPKFLTTIGTDIIQRCPEVSMVNIGVNRSAWTETIGIFEDGGIRRFECIESSSDRRTDRLPYGFINCDI
jgi:hypothetical protein